MYISSKKRKLFRKYERALFFKDYKPKDKRYVFYLLLLPIVEWLKPQMRKYNLEDAEINSELFLLSTRVFEGFDKEKSSIIPYLRKQLPWYISSMFKQLGQDYSTCVMDGPAEPERNYYLNEEYYWEKILFEDRWVGKCFTRGEKYLIFILLTSDQDMLSHRALAKVTNMERHTIKTKLHEIRETLEEIYG